VLGIEKPVPDGEPYGYPLNAEVKGIRVLSKSSFFRHSLLLCGSSGVTPSLPRRRRQHPGSIPFSPCFVGVFHQPSDGYRTIGGCLSGGGSKHDLPEPPGATACFSQASQQSRSQGSILFFIYLTRAGRLILLRDYSVVENSACVFEFLTVNGCQSLLCGFTDLFIRVIE